MEPRQLLAATPLALAGTAGANTVYLREDADHVHLDVWQNAATPGAGTPTRSVLMANVSTVTVTAGGATDAVTVDFTNGDPFASTVAVIGNATAVTTLTVVGKSAAGQASAAMGVSATAVTVGPRSVSYNDVQGITVVGGPGDETLTQSAQPPAPVVFAGGGGADTLNVNAGTYTLAGDPSVLTASLTVNDAANVYFQAAAAGTGVNVRTVAKLTVAAGGAATADAPPAAADRAVLVVGSLSVAVGGTLDLTGNDLIVRGGSAAGVNSSLAPLDPGREAAVGVMANATAPGAAVVTSFDGQPVSATDTLVRYTTFGDANLDGVVNAADYVRLDAGFLAKGSLTGWANGDFNGDGVIDGSDYTLADTAFNVPAAPSPLVSQLSNALSVAAEQARKTVAAIGASANYPQKSNADGTWTWTSASDWTAGTWAGELWELYAATGDAYFKAEATAFTTPLAANQTATGDVGPRVYDAFFPLLQQQPGNQAAVSVMLNAVAAKATTYNATVGAFKAWYGGDGKDRSATFDVLTDYMMDQQLLFWASAQSGDQTYYNEAVSNATVTEQHNVRADGSTAQFSFFDPTTGAFANNQTYQGYSATSTWSRGQAWAIYGFTQTYAATGRADFLATAEKTADWFIAHSPADGVPFWDFDQATVAGAPRDSSAAAVAASGLLQLSKQIAAADPTNAARYRAAAGHILGSLASPAYLNSPSGVGAGVLLHAASNVPAGITDDSLDYGDYFFVQAINEYLAG